jgi:YVTN family beta-propeller protein
MPLRTVTEVPLTGGTDRFDYQSLDADAHRLYLAHMDSDRVTVVDTQANQVLADVTGIRRPTGVLVVPALGRVFASASAANELVAIETQTNQVAARIPTGGFPDGVAFDPGTGHVFVSNESGRSDTVIDPRANRAIATIDLGSEAGNTQYDAGSGLMVVNAQSTHQLVALDPKTNQVAARYDLPGADGNHGLAIDAKNRLAFIACEGNAKLLVFDLDAHKVLDTQPVGDNPDVLAFDPGNGALYVASESGTVAIFKEEGRGLHKLAQGFLAKGAHTVSVDPATHRLYFPLPDVNGQPTLRVMEPRF